MTAPDRSALAHFDHWLDAMVSGMPAPETGKASDATTDPASSRDVQNAARQFHGLAARADRTTQEFATTTRLNTIWEDIMDAQLAPTAAVTGNTAHGEAPGARAGTGTIERSPVPLGRFQPIINGMLAAALILAVATGIWRAQDGFDLGFGNGEDDQMPVQFSAMTGQGEATFEADPVPTADECTIAPLTVDEVIEIFQKPLVYIYEPGNQIVPMATPAAGALSEPPPVVRPEPSVIQEIVATQRTWLACMIAGDPFQVWAMESDVRIVQSIGNRYLGGYDLEAIRADLEAVQRSGAKGTRFELPAYSDDTLVPMVIGEDIDIYYTHNVDTFVSAALYWTTVDGALAGRPGYLTEKQFNDPAHAPLRDQFVSRNNTGIYTYSTDRNRWLFQGTEGSGG